MKSKSSAMLRKYSFFVFLFALANTFNISAQTADVTQGCAPLSVKFTNKQGVAKPYWDFKDGVKSELANPTNIFTKPGTYSVDLRDGSATGAILGSVKISVYAQPSIGFKGSPLSGCTPLTVPFSSNVQKDDAITINSYIWTFGDGGSSTLANPSYTYNNAGTFSIGLTLKTNFASCDVSASFKDTVKTTAAPFVIFNANPGLTSCTAPFPVTFINASNPKTGVTFAWDFGNGTKVNGVDAPPQTYSKNGAYSVSLTGTAANGCKSTYTAVVSVGKPRAAFTFPNDTLCLKSSYKPKNLSAFGNYIWDFGVGSQVNDPTLKEPIVTWQTPGLKTVKLKVTESSGGCQNDTTATIFIEDLETPIKATYNAACQNPIKVTYETIRPFKQYDWLFSTQDLMTSTLPKPMVNWINTDPSGYSQVGAFNAFAVVSLKSYAGCNVKGGRVDTFYFPNARIVPNKWQGCAPLTVEFADSSYTNPKDPITEYTYLWADGSAPEKHTNKAIRAHTFTKPGEYKVRLVIRNSKGCIDTSHVVLIEVGEEIAADFSVDKTSVCIGDTVKFTTLTKNPNIDAWHYSTEGDRSFHCYGDPNPSWSYGTVGKQSVSLTVGYNGCFKTVTKNDLVTVKGPLAKIDYLVPCAPNNLNVNFKSLSQEFSTLSWDFGDTTQSSQSTLTHTYKKSGDYKVKLTATNPATGCPASVDSVTVFVRNLNAELEIVKEATGLPAGFNLCLGERYKLFSKKSTDVNTTCHSGYTWYFSDPNERPVTLSNDNTQFIPKIPGNYKVILAVRDVNGCVDSVESKHRVFGVYPKVTFNPKEICIPNDVTFDGAATKGDTTLVEWKWTFGDTPTEDKTPNKVIHKYTLPPALGTTYLVRLELKDAVGCGGSWFDTVGFYRPESVITAKSPICLGDTLTISASDFTTKGNNLTYTWTVDGTNKGTSQTIKHYFATDGDKTIRLNFRETKTNCPGTTTASVQVQTKPNVDFNIPASVCAPNTVEFKNATTSKYPLAPYSWDFGNGQSSNEKDGVVFYDKKGKFKVTLFAETTAGCKASKEKEVDVKEGPKGDFTMSKNVICLGESITFTLKDTAKVGSFTWSFGDGKDTTKVNPITHAYTSRNGTQVQFTTKAKLLLQAVGGGCETTKEQDITINNVFADFDILNNNACALDTIKFINKSGNAATYFWDFGDGSTSASKDNVFHKYNHTVTQNSYSVTLTATGQGCANKAVKKVTLRLPILGGDANFPSIFTPGTNDVNGSYTFVSAVADKTKCEVAKEIEKFEIFDRWGHKVFASGEITDNTKPPKWDGGEHPADVYMAVFYFKDKTPPVAIDVTLVR